MGISCKTFCTYIWTQYMSKLLLHLLRNGKITTEEYETETGGKAPDFSLEDVEYGTAVAQHHSTAAASRGVITNDAQIIITGDNNYINRMLPLAQQSQVGLTRAQFETEIHKYLRWVIAQNRTISLRGVQHSGRNVIDLDLDTVYVPLSAQSSNSRRIELSSVLTHGKRLIVTGGPGCGKTTVLMYLAWVLAEAFKSGTHDLAMEKLGFDKEYGFDGKPKSNDKSEDDKKEPVIPLPIVLPVNRYAKHLRDTKWADAREETLAAFISNYLIKRSASLDLPRTFFRDLLKQGKQVILLLDGLDEVPNEEERANVSQAIENLVAGHLDLRVIVTCRTAAYNGRVALAQEFCEIKALPLDQMHITSLIENAYKAVEPDRPQFRQGKIDDLLGGIAHMEQERRRRLGGQAKRLITSPLLVRMLLLVHLSERQLPQQRAELYAKAVDNMILPSYTHDSDVQTELSKLVGDRVQHLELVQYIAFHMHEQGEAQGREIDEFDLRRLLEKESRFAPLIPLFIQTTREREGLMEERLGSYRFTHLAFQEFLTARYMVEELLFEQNLTSYIENEAIVTDSWWREPLLLLGGYLSITSARRTEWYVRFLAGLEGSHIATQEAEKQWSAVELAGTVINEWPTVSDTLQVTITKRQVVLIEESGHELISASVRASVGIILGQLGDPRFGVRLKSGLPAIAWGEEVPADNYWVGGDDDVYESFKRQKITIPQPYKLSCYLVTYAQFQSFLENDGAENDAWWEDIPDHYREMRNQKWPITNHPRETVSWYQAAAFCRWLTTKSNDGYLIRLPHEYEWKVAAWFNDGRIFPWGNDFEPNRANTEENGFGQTTAVGLYPNGRQPHLNLYDMSGNIFEWCQNKYENPGNSSVDASNDWRVLLGGSWSLDEYLARATSRFSDFPSNHFHHVGFRLCRVYPPSLL